MESKELLRTCAASSDAGAWRQLVEYFGDRVEIGVRRILREAGHARAPADVEDFVQEVYVRLCTARGKALLGFRGQTEAEASSYLGRLAENVTRDRIRRKRAEKRCYECQGMTLGPWASQLKDGALGPEERCLRAERQKEFLRSCRDVLPASNRQRDTWILRRVFLDGWSSREVAVACRGRVAAASVNSLVSRTRRRLAARGVHLPERDRR